MCKLMKPFRKSLFLYLKIENVKVRTTACKRVGPTVAHNTIKIPVKIISRADNSEIWEVPQIWIF